MQGESAAYHRPRKRTLGISSGEGEKKGLGAPAGGGEKNRGPAAAKAIGTGCAGGELGAGRNLVAGL
jgi:hypothetical protein